MPFIMASSSLTHTRRYHVFPSFHGQDVRKGFLSHVHNYFESKGIRMFKDHEIERGHTIGPKLLQAIRESRVSIVVLSKKYASSSWCLDELVEIFKCEEAFGQVVMTIFYDVDPSDVRKQFGDFGEAFEKTCEGKTEDVKQRWSQALAHVATIAGEHSLNWANEAEMIQKIAKDVSNNLNLTPSRDFEGMVGLNAHLNKLDYFLCLCSNDDVKMIGIWGPAGIGKTTIARALYNQLSSRFQLKCFMGNLKESCKSLMGYDDYDSMLCLQSQLLSKILNQMGMKVHHLGAIKEWLEDQRVLIILDDVDDLEQLETLAKDLSWFGSGSRIIVTTEDKKILKAHGIQDIYHVDFPSWEEALEILCLCAFKQSSVKEGFEELAKKVAVFCGRLPLGLRVVGLSLRGESKDEWEDQLSIIESSLDRKIENILRVGYDRLLKKYQSLFLHIACFFNNEVIGNVISVLSNSDLDVEKGLKTLAEKSLVYISYGRIKMHHHLLHQLGRQIVFEQSNEPGKRQFLVEADDIYDVLKNETGTGSIIGISLKYDKTCQVCISKRAFEGMSNLQFLRIYRRCFDQGTLHIPEDMTYLPRLKLLDWHFYQKESLPPRFQTDCLVELRMRHSSLKKLWGGIQPLPNLKIIDLRSSFELEEIPNLSKATNLKTLDLSYCLSLKKIPNLSKATNLETLNLPLCQNLVELPSSISSLHKLKMLIMWGCEKLKVIPTNINLASLQDVDMNGCLQLRKFPDISTNIKTLQVRDTMIREVPPSIVGWSRLEKLYIGNRRLQRLTHSPVSITLLNLSNSDIKSIPDCVISLPHLVDLFVEKCSNLMSIPALSPSLKSLHANDCVSLKSVCCSFPKETKELRFSNCWNLDEESRRDIIQQSIDGHIYLPGKEIPAQFTHKAPGNSVTIPLAPGTFSASSTFKACIQILPSRCNQYYGICCNLRSNGGETLLPYVYASISDLSPPSEHLFILHGDLFPKQNICHVAMSEITFEFSFKDPDNKIIECGVEIMKEEAEGSSTSREMENFETECSRSEVDNYEIGSSSTNVETYEIKSNKNHHTDGDGDYEAEVDNYETESSSTKVESYEIRSNNNHHIDGEGDNEAEVYNYETESGSSKVDCSRGNNSHSTESDGDGDYEAEGSKFSQVESTKTSKHTGCWSWLRKFGLKEKKMNKTE